MYKPLADSTLMAMTKKEIIEHLRIAEHNHKVCEEQIEQQYKNCMKLLKEERADAIEEFFKAITEHTIVCTDGVTEVIDVMDIIKCKEQLKEQKND